MYGGLLSVASELLCLLTVGAAIKLMDDYLDAEYDICRGKHTLSVKLSRATLPYAMVLLAVSVYLNSVLAMSAFLGSYAVGMLSTWTERLPTRVPAYVEVLIALGASVLLVGWRAALWGAALMAMIDWLDDLVDRLGDTKTGQRNMALRIGFVETTLLTLIALCAAVLSNAWWTVLGFIAFTILSFLSEVTTSSLWRPVDEEERVDL